MIWLIVGASEAAIIFWLMFEIMRAPNGYQDESGFHEVKEGDVCSKIEGRAGAIPVEIHREVATRRKKPGLSSM